MIEPDSGSSPGGKPDNPGSAEIPLAFDDAYFQYFQCFDGEVEIGIYDESFAEERIYGMGDLELDAANIIRIRANGEIHEFEQNTIYTTDGAGNDTVQVLYLRSHHWL